jgi:signal transduction histidine kinase
MVALAMRYPARGSRTRLDRRRPAGRHAAGRLFRRHAGSDARMAVFKDGVRLAGAIVATPHATEADLARRLAAMRSAAVRRFRDDSERLVAMHSLQQFGLDVVLTRDTGVMLVGWRQAVRIVLLVVVFLLLVITGAAWLIVRANGRRALAQQALQAQQARSSKFNSLGVLASAVARDFNNVLASIVGYGEMAQDAAVPSAQRRHLDMVIKAALRGKTLVERILSFSGGGARASTPFALEPIVEEVLAMLAGSLPAGIEVKRQLQAAGAQLNGDPTQAFEAVMNLCTNAIGAMPGGGTLTVDLLRAAHGAGAHPVAQPARRGQLPWRWAWPTRARACRPASEHLFEPFFTTRAAQSGTGPGLAVVHGVVTELGGAIDVASQPGRGALFTPVFPGIRGRRRAASPAEAPHGAGQAVMVVDDDADLVAMLSEMLAELGYAPVGYTDPQAALQALLAAPQRYALVITDEVMPGMSGTMLAQTLSSRHPGLPLILLSGYGGPLMAAKAVTAGVSTSCSSPCGARSWRMPCKH